uniref:Arrestin domain-containing protein 3-like n=1 Tax=Diabrotica virgifera virgifera TaxID=50390 RepID=A0A6P7EZK5_DIAVI
MVEKRIKCRFRGQEHVEWTVGSGRHKQYINKIRNFIKADTEFVDKGTMMPGRYEYNFEYILPPSDIPSSFDHEFGSIRYFLYAFVDRPWAFDYEHEVEVQVIAPILHPPNQTRPIPVEVNNKSRLCCWPSKPSTMEIQLEKNHYALGEPINFRVLINNRSSSAISNVLVQLSRKMKFSDTRRNHKKEKVILAQTGRTGVQPGCSQLYTFSLAVPQTTVIPNFTGCLLFKEWCSLKVEAVYPSFRCNMVARESVNVGNTIPTQDGFQINTFQYNVRQH